jgi:hypothetical protein
MAQDQDDGGSSLRRRSAMRAQTSDSAQPAEMPPLVAEKLAAFDRLAADFEASFQFVQEVHGHRRLETFPVPAIVRYFHALWVCDCKDRLLSVPRTIERYEGARALTLLGAWQRGEAAEVIDFLAAKLDMLPFSQITSQLQEALDQQRDPARVQRLEHGRVILLNRGFNLHHALEAIFALSPSALLQAVRSACAHHAHTPEQIERQLADLRTPLYSMLAHPALAQRNMVVMNALGIRVTDNGADRPGHRTSRVASPTLPTGPYAQTPILGEVEMTPRAHDTHSYMPSYDAQHVILNNPDAPPEPTGEIERHPRMS